MRIVRFFQFWMDEIKEDKRLQIKTIGRDGSRADEHRHPYEPTPYSVLERLADAGYIGKENTLVDYGCGKGRVAFFFSDRTGCRTTGIECDESFFADAIENQRSAGSAGQTAFVSENAERCPVSPEADRFFFFNPFSVEILQEVMERIKASYCEKPRRMLLFFYYPSHKYTAYLKTVDRLSFVEDIDCMDLFPGKDEREKISVFEFPLTQSHARIKYSI